MRLWFPLAATWQDGGNLCVDVPSDELANIIAEQASQQDIRAMLSTLNERMPHVFSRLAASDMKSAPSYKRLAETQPAWESAPSHRARPSSIYLQRGEDSNGNPYEEQTWEENWSMHGSAAKRQKSWHGTAEKPKKQCKLERELVMHHDVEADLDLELLSMTEEHLRGNRRPVLVSKLTKEVVTKFQDDRPWLTEALKLRVALRHQLISTSLELVWLPGTTPLDNQVQWDPTAAQNRLESQEKDPAFGTADGEPRSEGKIKTYNMSAGYGFITCSEVSRDVYFLRAELPGSLTQRKVAGGDAKARRSDWFKGYDVTFVLDLLNEEKPQAKCIQFTGDVPE